MPEPTPLFGGGQAIKAPTIIGGGFAVSAPSVDVAISKPTTLLFTEQSKKEEKKFVTSSALILGGGLESLDNKSKRLINVTIGNDYFTSDENDFMIDHMMKVLSAKDFKALMSPISDGNIKANSDVSNISSTLDSSDSPTALANARKLITGSYGIFEKKLTVEDVRPHLEMSAKIVEDLIPKLSACKSYVEGLLNYIRVGNVIIKAAEGHVSEDIRIRTMQLIHGINLSVAMVKANIEILEKDTQKTLGDINLLLSVAIPTWLSARRK